MSPAAAAYQSADLVYRQMVHRYTSKYVIMSNNSNYLEYLAPTVLLQHDAVSFVDMFELIVSRS